MACGRELGGGAGVPLRGPLRQPTEGVVRAKLAICGKIWVWLRKTVEKGPFLAREQREELRHHVR